MKSIRLHAVRDLRLHEDPMPSSKPGCVLIRVTAVGVCGSDLHWYAEGGTGTASLSRPFILGHEFSAVIQEGPRMGQRVAVEPQIPCRSCEYCEMGNPNLCEDHVFAGQSPQDGALQEYMVWPEENLFPIPDEVSDEDAAMLEPLGVAIHTVNLGKVKPGDSVCVLGCGPIGLLILQMAKLAGASQIIATDKYPHRLEAARRYGATETYIADNHGIERPMILSVTNQRGVDVAFEAAGENEAVITAMDAVRPGGRVVLCGIPSLDNVQFRASTARRKGLTVKFVRRMKHTYLRAIDLTAKGLVDVRSLVTHHFPLEQSREAFETANKRDGLKVMIRP